MLKIEQNLQNNVRVKQKNVELNRNGEKLSKLPQSRMESAKLFQKRAKPSKLRKTKLISLKYVKI